MFEISVVCALGFAVGYFAGVITSQKKKKEQNIDERADREKRKFERELRNFYNYTGDEQE